MPGWQRPTSSISVRTGIAARCATSLSASESPRSTNSGGAVAVTDSTPPVTVTGGGLAAGAIASLSITDAQLYLNITGVVTVNTNSPVLTNGVSGGVLTLSWPTDHTGWRLLVQTNNLATGVSSNTNDWMTVVGSAATNQVALPVDVTKPTEFYRLVYP